MGRTVVVTVEVWRSTTRVVAPCGQRWWANDELLPGKLAEVVTHTRDCPDCRLLTRPTAGAG
jgi:hypothetical protein